MRVVFAIAISCLGLACTGTDPLPPHEAHELPPSSAPAHAVPPSQEQPVPQCPAGTERRERGGEGPDASDWWCTRGDVRHGPFHHQDFDVRDRTWHEIRGEHVDGQRHGMVHAEGFYAVEHSGRSRVFRRELYDHGRLVRSNEASLRVELDAATPVVTRRFLVKAAGLARTAAWEGEADAVGSFDVDVSTHWVDAPADAPPSVLRLEVTAPHIKAPTRTDALLHSAADPDPPRVAGDLPPSYVPLASATWVACDPGGCTLELVVTLRWLTPGPGRLDTHVTARAVPDAWPETGTIDVTVMAE